MKLVRSVLISLAVAAGAFAVSAPFLVIEHWLGFAALAVSAFLFLVLRQRHGLPDERHAYRAGFLIATVLLVPARFMADILESGFDDGPFRGQPFAGDLSKTKPSERVPFRSGELVVYNRADGRAPILVYRAGGRTRWAHEMFVSMTTADTTGENELHDITRLRVSPGIIRDRLDFIGTWTFGAEHGYAFVWRWGGIQRFYLSW